MRHIAAHSRDVGGFGRRDGYPPVLGHQLQDVVGDLGAHQGAVDAAPCPRALHHGVAPLIIQIPGSYNSVAIRLGMGSLIDAMEKLEQVWNRFLPAQPFEYEFLDDSIQALYESDLQLRRVFGFFSTLSIFISCLGMLGLVTHMAQQRTKEMGIRKVLGASSGSLLLNLSGDFIKLAFLSFILAFPIAYYLGESWLADFAYRVDIGIGVFLVATLATLVLVALTVGVQSWRTATADPVESLRHE